jgi:hypothetical protein
MGGLNDVDVLFDIKNEASETLLRLSSIST